MAARGPAPVREEAPTIDRARGIERREALAAAEAAARILLDHRERGVRAEEKAGGEPVSIADRAADEAIRAHLARAFPGDALLTEESVDDPRRLRNRRVWIVDPLDGTKDFLAGLDEFAVHVALAEDGRPVVGVVLRPVGGRAWTAVHGQGTEERSPTGGWRRLRLPERPRTPPLLATSRLRRSRSLQAFRRHLPEHRTVPSGSLGLKAAMLARGDCDLYAVVSRNLGEWDGAAPELVVREAGGRVTDLAGGEVVYNRPEPRLRRGLLMGHRDLVGPALAAARAVAPEIPWLAAALGGDPRPGGRGAGGVS